MTSIINKITSMKRIFVYGVVGISAFVVEYFSFMVTFRVIEASYSLVIAQTISFCLGLLVSYTGNRLFTFNEADKIYAYSVRKQVGLYLLLAVINLVLSNVIIYMLVHGFLITPSISKLIVMSMVVLWNFFIFNKLIFKSK